MSSEDDEVLLAVHIKTIIILVLCAAGINGHIISIYLLYSMISPNNLFLIGMSCTQVALCANFFYSSLFKYLSDVLCISQLWSHAWVTTLLVSVNASVVVHMSGVFHVVTLSIVRFISLNQVLKIKSSEPWFSYNKCLRTIVLINIGAILLCTPFFFNSEVRKVSSHDECSSRYPHYVQINPMRHHDCDVCVADSEAPSNSVIIRQEVKRKEWTDDWIEIFMPNEVVAKFNSNSVSTILTFKGEIIMINFVIVELPQGIISVLSSVKGASFVVSESLGDLFDIFSLLNSCITFALFVL
ncbi:BMA-DMSR-3, isoform a [Dirofilaria immitis]|nr:BMA-DMSR-3, isoform a [Dirofilaria immitis]